MKHLKAEEVLVIHSEVIDATGGLHGIREVNLFLSIIEKPKSKYAGNDLYLGIYSKASAYLESFLQYHVFLDGNKRTAIAAASRFLFINGYELATTNKEVEIFVLKIVVEKMDIKTISAWFKKHSKKLK